MAYPQTVVDPTAVFGRRVIAALIDAALVLGTGIAVASSDFQTLDAASTGRTGIEFCQAYNARIGGACFNLNDTVYFHDARFSLASLAPIGFSLVLFVLVQGLTGWTLGKLVTGIRTVREDGRRPGLVKAFVRWLLWIVDGFPYIVPLLGFIVGLTTQGHRRVGDVVAKTFVVRRSAEGSPIVVPGMNPATNIYATDPPSTFGATGPQWDATRNTYIQWDATQGSWFQWDETARAWTPIAGG